MFCRINWFDPQSYWWFARAVDLPERFRCLQRQECPRGRQNRTSHHVEFGLGQGYAVERQLQPGETGNIAPVERAGRRQHIAGPVRRSAQRIEVRRLSGCQEQFCRGPIEFVRRVVVIVIAAARIAVGFRREQDRIGIGRHPCLARCRKQRCGKGRVVLREQPRGLRGNGRHIEGRRRRGPVQRPRFRILAWQHRRRRSTLCHGSCGAPSRQAAHRPAPSLQAGTAAPIAPRRADRECRCRFRECAKADRRGRARQHRQRHGRARMSPAAARPRPHR